MPGIEQATTPAEEYTTVEEDPQEQSDLTSDQIEAEAESALYRCAEPGCTVYGEAKGGLTECERLGVKTTPALSTFALTRVITFAVACVLVLREKLH